jgi:hypothetical protein
VTDDETPETSNAHKMPSRLRESSKKRKKPFSVAQTQESSIAARVHRRRTTSEASEKDGDGFVSPRLPSKRTPVKKRQTPESM